VAAAKAAVAPYLGKPSAFPVTAKLEKRPAGATVAFVDCGTPVCALLYDLVQPAAKTMGFKLDRIRAGQTASGIKSAFDDIQTLKPKAVIVSSIEIGLWGNDLKTLLTEKIPVASTGITGLQPYAKYGPLAPPLGAEPQFTTMGRLLADYVVANFGQSLKVVYYSTPELSFTAAVNSAFHAELASKCPSCSYRVVPIAAATLGNSAPNTVVSDLESHPGTNVAVFGTDEVAFGLPAALKAAGLKVKTAGVNPAPTNLQYLKAGQEDVSISADLPVAEYEAVDQLARLIDGQKLTGPEAQGLTDFAILTKKDITFNPANGWTGYPDFAKRFAALWGL
jgi:ribose transport system substrate-binding protein